MSGQVFLSRRERRRYEQEHAASTEVPDAFSELLGLAEQHAHPASQTDVREGDGRLGDARRNPDAIHTHRADALPVSTQTGRVRLRPEEIARATNSAPAPITLPGPNGLDASGSADATSGEASAATTRRGARGNAPATPHTSRRGAGTPKRTDTRPGSRATAPARRAATKAVRTPNRPTRRPAVLGRSPLTKLASKVAIMLAAIGLVATTAVPAYAQFQTPTWTDPISGKTQTLAVGAVAAGAIDHDDFAAHTTSAALDSTMGSVVAPEVEALAQQLMTAVAQGRLTGDVPDHIFEIRYLAAGEAVPGCGIDYRVLQAIGFALTQFNTVGVSDINRHCTGQIEGAGTASAHYTDGGGHAVDFFRLNGHALTGGDPDSIKLIHGLDAVVPADATVGQVNCRSGLSLSHFKQIDDTCNHLHVDFLDAKGATLLG